MLVAPAGGGIMNITTVTVTATILEGGIDMTTYVITGASSGLGKCIAAAIRNHSVEEVEIINWSLDQGVDVRDSISVAAAAEKFTGPIDALINCAGINHIEFIPKLLESDWDRIIDTNAKGIYLVTQACLPWLRGGTVLNIVSNASHMPMTSSLAYNASKGAAEIMTKQMSRELIKTHNITVFGISPNKLKNTGMSAYIDNKVQELRGWTAEEARNYQLASLPAGEETDPETLAEFIAFILSSKQRHKYFAGCIIPYGL
jgi:NAD(P)-dependent dehydrogenase (short-subunit alcohol dehydrogenase family)